MHIIMRTNEFTLQYEYVSHEFMSHNYGHMERRWRGDGAVSSLSVKAYCIVMNVTIPSDLDNRYDVERVNGFHGFLLGSANMPLVRSASSQFLLHPKTLDRHPLILGLTVRCNI